MSKYSEEEKKIMKEFIMQKVSEKLDSIIIDLDRSYDYDSFRNEVWLDGFSGEFAVHFVPANEMNGGKNYHIDF